MILYKFISFIYEMESINKKGFRAGIHGTIEPFYIGSLAEITRAESNIAEYELGVLHGVGLLKVKVPDKTALEVIENTATYQKVALRCKRILPVQITLVKVFSTSPHFLEDMHARDRQILKRKAALS